MDFGALFAKFVELVKYQLKQSRLCIASICSCCGFSAQALLLLCFGVEGKYQLKQSGLGSAFAHAVDSLLKLCFCSALLLW